MNLEECFSQIDSCEFECEGGPLRLNVGYIGLKSNIAELEQQLAELREAFDRLISVAEQCDGWEFFPSEELDAAISALKEQTP